jgi:hypothetical protein
MDFLVEDLVARVEAKVEAKVEARVPNRRTRARARLLKARVLNRRRARIRHPSPVKGTPSKERVPKHQIEGRIVNVS